MICEKTAAIFLLITMSSPGYEDGKVEMCFERWDQCIKFEEYVMRKIFQHYPAVTTRSTLCHKKTRRPNG
jgi:hypothetical protein